MGCCCWARGARGSHATCETLTTPRATFCRLRLRTGASSRAPPPVAALSMRYAGVHGRRTRCCTTAFVVPATAHGDGVSQHTLRASLVALLLAVTFLPSAGQTQHPLVQFGADLSAGSGALSTWTGSTVCSGATTTTWLGVTCASSQPRAIALPVGLYLTGSISCAVASSTTLTSLDLVRNRTPRIVFEHAFTAPAARSPNNDLLEQFRAA